MAILHEYHCPTSLAEALRLIDAPDRRRHLLAGGTTLVGALETRAVRDVDGVVDLRRLGLDTMRVEEETIHIGAMTTLTDLATHPATRDLAGGLLPRAVRGEGPVNLRNQATVGGVIATAAYDSELYAALLALAADVMIHSRAGDVCRPLADLGPIDGIITEVRVARRDGRRGDGSKVTRRCLSANHVRRPRPEARGRFPWRHRIEMRTPSCIRPFRHTPPISQSGHDNVLLKADARAVET